MPKHLTNVERIQSSDVLKFDSIRGIVLPTGNTNDRSETPIPGQMRYNNQTDRLEFYISKGKWVNFLRSDTDDSNSLDVTSLNVGGSSVFDANVLMKKSLTVGGELKVDKETILNSNTEVRGNFEVDNNASFNSSVNITGDIISQGGGSFQKSLTIGENLQVLKDLNVGEHTSINKTLDVYDNITGEANLFIKLNADIDGNLNVDKNTSLNEDLYVGGASLFDNVVTINGQTQVNNQLIVTSTATLNSLIVNDVVSLKDNVTIDKDLEIKGSLNAWLDSEFENDLLVGGDLTVTGNLTVNGNISYVNSTVVEVKDTVIELNRGETGAGVSMGYAGIEIDRGTQQNVRWIWDETNKFWGPEGTKFLGNIDTIYALNIDNVLTIDAIGALRIPIGDTPERPNISPLSEMDGMVRFNRDLERFEGFNNTDWERLSNVRTLKKITNIAANTFFDIVMTDFGLPEPDPENCIIRVMETYTGPDPDFTGFYVDGENFTIGYGSGRIRVKNNSLVNKDVEIIVYANN